MKKDIYVITNLITGLQYVGQSQNAIDRFKAHKLAADNTLFHQAIKEYGIDNFSLEILEEQIENFNEKERYWIEKLNTLYPNGYNMVEGGGGYPHLKGELCYQAKLSEKELIKIKDLLMNTKISEKDIGLQFNVTQEIISNINCGKTYYHNDWNYPLRSNEERLKIINNIKQELKNSLLPLQKIAEKYQVSKALVNSINQGKNYADSNIEYPIRKGVKGYLDNEQILCEIKELLISSNKTTEEIAQMYGVQRTAIEQINNGKTYYHENWDYPLRKQAVNKNAFTEEQLKTIEDLLINTDLSFRQIAKQMGIATHGPISNINQGKTKRYINPNLTYPLRKY